MVQELRVYGNAKGKKKAIDPENLWSWATPGIHSRIKSLDHKASHHSLGSLILRRDEKERDHWLF